MSDNEKEMDMRCIGLLLIVGLLAASLVSGCESASDPQGPSKDVKSGQTCGAGKTCGASVAKVCIKCGQLKGSDLCCKPGQKLCSACKLVKGSPGCCSLPKGANADVKLCTKCGFIKGSADCCKTAGKKKCPSCGLVKGSPGCCKIKCN